MRQSKRIPRGRRPAFTLVELLIVMAIMAILVSLTASATMRFIGAQQVSNTKTALTKLQLQLERQVSAVRDKAMKEPLPPAILGMANGDPQRAQVIWVKLRLKQAFPVNFAEILARTGSFPSGSGLDALPAYVTYMSTMPVGSVGADKQSSVCLLMALQQGPSGGGVKMEDLGVAGMIADAGGGVRYLIDAWGQPLTFWRWPVSSPILNASPYPGLGQLGFNDPGDRQGMLTARGWVGGGGWALFVTPGLIHPLPKVFGMSYKAAPMIVSNGPDKNLGLKPLVDQNTLVSDGSGLDRDNLYSVEQ